MAQKPKPLRLTPERKFLLQLGAEREHDGGFYTTDRHHYKRCEKLRAAGLLKFWNDRRSLFWTSQYFTITEAGRRALTQ